MTVGSGGKASRHQRGFIVLAVLWILAALSALVLVYLNFVTTTAVVIGGATERIQTEALLTAAVELTAFQLIPARTDDERPTSGVFKATVGAARVAVTFRSEAARIDLNAAPKLLLAGLFAGMGVAPAVAEGYADRIVAWRSKAEGGENDPETAYYRASGVAYAPRHAPFPASEELWLVQGIPPALVERVLPLVTVFGNAAPINILDAAPQVVAALPNMTPERLQAILSQRSDPRTDPRATMALANGDSATLEGSAAYRLTIDAELDNGRRTGADVVIMLLKDADEPYRVLSWRGMFDGEARQEVSVR